MRSYGWPPSKCATFLDRVGCSAMQKNAGVASEASALSADLSVTIIGRSVSRRARRIMIARLSGYAQRPSRAGVFQHQRPRADNLAHSRDRRQRTAGKTMSRRASCLTLAGHIARSLPLTEPSDGVRPASVDRWQPARAHPRRSPGRGCPDFASGVHRAGRASFLHRLSDRLPRHSPALRR